MSVKNTFETLMVEINNDPFGIEGINNIYQFNIKGDEESSYQLKIENNKVEFYEFEKFEPDCTLTLSSGNFLKLADGELNPQQAFMMGQIKVKGDIFLGMKLSSILQSYR